MFQIFFFSIVLIFLLLIWRLLSNNCLDDVITHESSSINHIIQDRKSQKLKMNPDLMCSSRYRITLNQAWVCLFIVKHFFKPSLTILYIRIISLNCFLLTLFTIILLSFFLTIHFPTLILIFLIFLNRSFLILQLKLSRHFINSIFMRDTLNFSWKNLLIPCKITADSGKVHFFHLLTLILFVEDLGLLFWLTINDQSRCQTVQSMQNKKVFVAFLNLKNGRQSVVVKTTASVDSEAWGFIYNQVILVFMND